jgi:peptidoglycan/LPS O-acetylase OafA/YrhL
MAMTKFRYDINALRALAVSAVVLFHYKADFIKGGFVGVDIFFVISGYLMTEIITRRLQKNSFSFIDFYYDRAKRIIPGLAALCAVLILVGYFFIDPMTYNYLGYTAVSALLFFSNIRFSEAVGYFDAQSEVKWLLHTWSLSVEWQFYLIYPIILFGLSKFSLTRRYLLPILWALAGISLFLCISYSTMEPAIAFYLLPQRAWELLAGGIVALQFRECEKKYSAAMLTVGFLLIGASMFFFNKLTPWPYYWALAPVIGTCLVIAANSAETFLFKNGLVQLIGKWSYSIYLWHWPIAVTAIYLNFTTTTALKIIIEIAILAAVLASGGVLLSFGTKLLNALGDWKSPLYRWAPIVGGLVLAMGLATTVTSNRGFADRQPDSARQLATYRMVVSDWDYPESCNGMDRLGHLRPCRLGRSDNRGTLVIGDSFAMQVFNRFAKPAQGKGGPPITFLASSACPPVLGIQMVVDRFHCNGFFDKALQFAEAGDFNRIALISAWYSYFVPANSPLCFVEGGFCALKTDPTWYFQHLDAALAGLRARLLALKQRGIEIVIVSATPSSKWDIPPELLKRQYLHIDTKEIESIDREEVEKRTLPMKGRLISLASSIGAKFVEPLDFLCDGPRCPTIDADGVPYYRDQGHFRSGAVRSARFRFLDEALGVNSQFGAIPAPLANN